VGRTGGGPTSRLAAAKVFDGSGSTSSTVVAARHSTMNAQNTAWVLPVR